jgi:hypothetical protein
MVIAAPCLVGVRGSIGRDGVLTSGRRLLGGHRTCSVPVHHDLEARISDTAEEIEILEPEEPVRVGQHTGIDDAA